MCESGQSIVSASRRRVATSIQRAAVMYSCRKAFSVFGGTTRLHGFFRVVDAADTRLVTEHVSKGPSRHRGFTTPLHIRV